MHRGWVAAAGLVGFSVWLSAAPAAAFCGFYVSGADTKLYANATHVVLLRDGVRTVLSMQNNYEGPPEGFAMVVPVPVVLHKDNVKTLPRAVFDRIDQLSAPRLVQYWEQDPCFHPRGRGFGFGAAKRAAAYDEAKVAPPSAAQPPLVRIEAEFTVGEYEVVILSAEDSTALDKWLYQNGYRIPQGAEPVLRPYVQKGSKFFVAKVDVRKVRFVDGMATLSPLRFHYDDDAFQLPVRLGLLNSRGVQDLIVQVLARGQRFEVANYPNVTIPTNIELNEAALSSFGAFYAALYDKTVDQMPGAVVTEYAWSAGSCDPCPGPTLDPADVATLGGDAISGAPLSPGEVVLTRLHVRYTQGSLGQDLVFRTAPPISGGNGWGSGNRHVAHRAEYGQSMFQGRYIVRHPWKGDITCTDPVFERWGGPPSGGAGVEAAKDLAFAPRGGSALASFVAEDVDVIGLKGTPPPKLDRRYRVSIGSLLRTGTAAVALGIAAGVLALWALLRRARGSA